MQIIRNSFCFASFFWVIKAHACMGCGQESSSLKMLLVGSLFAAIPMGLAVWIWWLVRKEGQK